jgi:preprotein translocase subunit SecA
MAVLQRIWEIVTFLSTGLVSLFERLVTSVVGSANARYLKQLEPKVIAVNDLEPVYQAMSNEELKQQTTLFRERLNAGESLDDLLVEAFAVCREAGVRYLQMRHYDEQLIGAMVLHQGGIAEMVTGEGKTLVATMPAYLNALSGKGVHVVTVNDYLARRDMEWMSPLYLGLGLMVGAIQSNMDVSDRQEAYDCDITYGTNNEFGFDYLRDNMRPAARGDDRFNRRQQQSQGGLFYAIVDEVDNILIDEARTPLIISGPAYDDIRKYSAADRISRQLKRDEHFTVNEKDRSANLTDEGIRAAEKMAGVESFYTAGNMEWPHLLDNSLKAHYLYKRDVNYVVKDGGVIIVDDFTGRLMEGRQWSDGLHQAVEAKEGVKIKEETQTLATITLQNYFKLYEKISGMTGTAVTEAAEFFKIYQLEVIIIPTHRPLRRQEYTDVIFLTEKAKYRAVADEIERLNRWDVLELENDEELQGEILSEGDKDIQFRPRGEKKAEAIKRSDIKVIQPKGRPVLVGTVSIEKSEHLSQLLTKRGIEHEVLNAKHHQREAEIVAQAGRLGGVTIATNMAGRGTDIVLGGNPETLAWARLQEKYESRLDIPHHEWEATVAEVDDELGMTEEGDLVKKINGLHVIGTERHEARRIDLQLRGRCGRQGDPGSSRFFLCLEDDLMRIFAPNWMRTFLERFGMKEDDPIESRLVMRRIEGAQKKVEERNFEIRKNLLEYDEVMDYQRTRVYSYRQRILDGENVNAMVIESIEQQVDFHVDSFLDINFGGDSFAEWAGNLLGTNLDGRDFRGMDFRTAESFALDEAIRAAETLVQDAITENLDPDLDHEDWNWEALTNFANRQWGLSLRDRDLKRIGADDLAEFLIEKSHAAISGIELEEGVLFLEPDYSIRTTLGWIQNKFGPVVDLDEMAGIEEEPEQIKELVLERAKLSYARREAEYPVMAGLLRYTQGSGDAGHLDREGLVEWARERFQTEISIETLRGKQRKEIHEILLQCSIDSQQKVEQIISKVHRHVDEMFVEEDEEVTAGKVSGNNGRLDQLSSWLKDTLDLETSSEELAKLNRHGMQVRLVNAVEDRFCPEIRRMERTLLLEIVDSAWKDHLLAMDHLRSAVGLQGYAQKDPKVEYKRLGRELFDQMWTSINERVTDLVFRIEQLDEGFVGSTWVESSATHAEASSTADIGRQQEAAIESSEGPVDFKPARRVGPSVGRNDPCPCGSGKKYKKCCMRK